MDDWYGWHDRYGICEIVGINGIDGIHGAVGVVGFRPKEEDKDGVQALEKTFGKFSERDR